LPGSSQWQSAEIIRYLLGSFGRAVRFHPACPGVSVRHKFFSSTKLVSCAIVRSSLKAVRAFYKVDRLTRALADFARMVELFDAQAVSFVAVTQQFNTTTSMGRLTLNVLLSFAQFEREVIGERIRDKVAASKRSDAGCRAAEITGRYRERRPE
jgi:hypothetical protein